MGYQLGQVCWKSHDALTAKFHDKFGASAWLQTQKKRLSKDWNAHDCLLSLQDTELRTPSEFFLLQSGLLPLKAYAKIKCVSLKGATGVFVVFVDRD